MMISKTEMRVRDHVVKILRKQNSSGGGVPAATAGQAATPNVPLTPGAQFDLAEMERRLKLLQFDSELQKLHSHLVIGAVLSETQFWSARLHMLDGFRV
ncbi:hypothetical protein MPTK1_8g08750 [Marchantia polymorpha subsp. ruderalis]|nr:hypothetical protein MARPO_0063s0044 [Marchantia polymorpha]BBN19215.1 hypothetical protein Mp_8g08750 [Marchantia polymorpha subsp. ruderalis]|eukprot:PTQ36497.1 hypothetical protein MARPO_0063s0044 [Marchantia polymorpha]